MKTYDELDKTEQQQVDDLLVIKVLEATKKEELPTDEMREQFAQFVNSQGTVFCACAGCVSNMRNALKKTPGLTEYVLGKAKALKDSVYVPGPNDLVIDNKP